jgi:hypothetical protein
MLQVGKGQGSGYGRACRHVLMTAEKPRSLPPIVIVTSSVFDESADSWYANTSLVFAPEHAASLKVMGFAWRACSPSLSCTAHASAER